MNELTLIVRDDESPLPAGGLRSRPQGPADAAGDVTLGVLRDQIQRSFVPQDGNEGSALLLTAKIG